MKTRGQFAAALAVCLSWPGLAISAGAPGPDAFGYTVTATTNFSFLQITNRLGTNVGIRVLTLDDDTPYTANIGFTFNFYGTNYANVSFNPNGLMTFTAQSSNYANVDLTTASPGDNLPAIAVLWDDWETQSVGADGVYYKTTGTAGSRQFTVQWNKVIPVNGDGINTVTFEVRLFEGSNRILFSYFDAAVDDETSFPPDAASLGVGATVGIRDRNGQTDGRNLQWSYNQAVITNGLNLLFTLPNRPPVAANCPGSTLEDTPVTLNVLTNASDPDADPLTLASFSQGTNGVVTTNANGTVTYKPATNSIGADHFNYTVSDGQGGSATGMVSVTVTPVNDPPTLDPLSGLTVNEDAGPQMVSLTGIGSGAANEPDTLTVTASSSNPALTTNLTVNYTSPNTTGSVSFNLPGNAFGTAVIIVTVNDGQPSNNIATRVVLVTVTPVNDVPTLDPLSGLTVNEDADPQMVSLTGISSGAANEPDTLTVTASSSNPALTTNLTVNYTSPNTTGSVSFNLPGNAFGTAAITVTVSDHQPSNNIVSRSFNLTVNPALKITSIDRQASGSILILFQGKPGNNYVMEVSADLLGWSHLGSLSEGDPGVFQFEDTGANGVDTRFYRVLAP